MSNLWLLFQILYLRTTRTILRWRLRRRGVDPDAIPEIRELRRRWEAGESRDGKETPREQ
jgi:hypothetical protein